MTEQIKTHVEKHTKSEISIIPWGLTKELQPADVSWNKALPPTLRVDGQVLIELYLYASHLYNIIIPSLSLWSGWACWLGTICCIIIVHHAFGGEQ